MTAAHFERVNMTRDELIREAATAAAQRVDDSVGLDPVTIITILTQVLPLVISCFKRNDEPQAEDIQRAVKRQCSTPAGRERLRRRTMRRIKSESDEPMSRSQAFALADAVIEEALNQNPQMVASVCAVVSDAEFGE
jgi:hypothetical protein